MNNVINPQRFNVDWIDGIKSESEPRPLQYQQFEYYNRSKLNGTGTSINEENSLTARNAIYAQSGGVTAVINASACGVIQTARQNPQHIKTVYAAQNGIVGALKDQLIDTSLESDDNIARLMHTPSGAFGSCRHKLQESSDEFGKLMEVFKARDIVIFSIMAVVTLKIQPTKSHK